MKRQINKCLLIISGLIIFTGCATTKNSLFLAAEAGDNESLRVLIDKGEPVNPENPDLYTPLMAATMQGHAESVKTLIEAGADVNRAPDGMTALLFASMAGRTDIVRLLIGAGADVNKIYEGGHTALMAATGYNHIETAKELLAAGTDVNVRNDEGATALMIAEHKGHVALTQILKQSGALSEDQFKIVFVVIDQTEKAYTVYYGIPEWKEKKKIDEIKANIEKEGGGSIIGWEEFSQNADSYVKSRIVRNEYDDISVINGIIELIKKYSLTPIGLTWNGGVAITRNDYQHAMETYTRYMKDSSEYIRVKKDIRSDPVNPMAHFGPLLGW